MDILTNERRPFRITGLPAGPFQHLWALSDADLARQHALRQVVDARPGFPDRIELREAEIGETVILLNHRHLPESGPYQSSHAIYVVEGATMTYDAVDRVPEVLRRRTLSLRAFDGEGLMVDADLVEGRDVETLIDRLFARPDVAFVHAHYARRGCFACRIDRVVSG